MCCKSDHIPGTQGDSYGSVSAVSSSGPRAGLISPRTRQKEVFVLLQPWRGFSAGPRGQPKLLPTCPGSFAVFPSADCFPCRQTGSVIVCGWKHSEEIAQESSLSPAGVPLEVAGTARLLVHGRGCASCDLASPSSGNQNRTQRLVLFGRLWKVPATLASVWQSSAVWGEKRSSWLEAQPALMENCTDQ